MRAKNAQIERGRTPTVKPGPRPLSPPSPLHLTGKVTSQVCLLYESQVATCKLQAASSKLRFACEKFYLRLGHKCSQPLYTTRCMPQQLRDWHVKYAKSLPLQRGGEGGRVQGRGTRQRELLATSLCRVVRFVKNASAHRLRHALNATACHGKLQVQQVRLRVARTKLPINIEQ